MVRKIILLTLITILVVIAFQGCAQAPTVETESLPDLGKIKVGYVPVIAPIYIAYEKGYFKEQGLDVELVPFDSGAKMVAALSAGQLDVGSGEAGTALLNAINQGFDVKVVMGTGSMPKGYGPNPFLVRKDLYDSGEVTDPKDLEGKNIAVNVPRGMVEYLVSEVLAKGGLTIDDVELVVLPFPEMSAAFANKAIDAAIMTEPLASKAVNDGLAVVLVGGDEIVDRMQISVMYFGKRLLDPANWEVGVRYLMGHLKAVREVYGGGWKNEEIATIVSEYTNMPVPVVQNSIKPYSEPNGAIHDATIENVQRYFIERGYVDYDQVIPLTEMLEPGFLEEALKRIGTFDEE
jgi:NitT/TauT family transport system substrate-binding protein